MLFHSWPFVILVIVTLLACLFVGLKKRWILLLIASLIFYGWWRVDYLGLMLLTVASCYIAAIAIERSEYPWQRQWLLGGVIAINLLVLAIFKYLGLFVDLLNSIAFSQLRPEWGLLLPVGISFYTFQSIGYAVDVYRGKVKAEYNPARLLLFVSFFPQLVAGPIERATRLMHELRQPIQFSREGFRFGLWMILWGFFKKLVIADRAALFVNHGFDSQDDLGGAVLLFSVYAFAIQIYCDFSAYSDIAIGTARLFGIRLMRNFNRPYSAKSLREFWQRWHISLSTWFRDYVYLPLGGNRTGHSRGGTIRWALNILIVFALSGLWHGAAWTFLSWGLLHGFGLLLERGWRNFPVSLKWLGTIHIVLLSWILFRAASLAESIQMVEAILANPLSVYGWRPEAANGLDLPILIIAIGWLYWVERPFAAEATWTVQNWVGGRMRAWTPWVILGTLFLCLNAGLFRSPIQFIYFQF